jgi:two-component system, cell cycle sensor histidine kinase and response regulator CckA
LSFTYAPLYVHLDIGRIEQIVMNLVLNAREAMPSGGELTVALSEVQVMQPGSPRGGGTVARELEPGTYAVIEVTDTGAGIDAETRLHIFEPFFTTKREAGEPSRGLGLSTVYGVVRGDGGSILVDSEVERGTTISVYIPLAGRDRIVDVTDREVHRTTGRERT